MFKKFNIEDSCIIEGQSKDSQIILYTNPDADEIREICETHLIDKHSLESALDPDEISRIEFDGDDVFIIWKRPKNYMGSDNLSFEVSSMGIFLFKTKLVIVCPEDISFLERKPQYPVNELWDVITNILYISIRHYLEHIKAIRLISKEIQKKINSSLENEHLIQMFNLGESLIYYINAISSNQTIFIKLGIYFDKLHVERKELFEDLSIENNQCLKQAEIYSTVLSGLMDARGNIVNNNMNILIKNLTIINIIFLPLNLLASIGGMSEFGMMTTGLDWRMTYGIFLLSMVVIGWITLKVLNKIYFQNKSSNIVRKSLLNLFKLRAK